MFEGIEVSTATEFGRKRCREAVVINERGAESRLRIALESGFPSDKRQP